MAKKARTHGLQFRPHAKTHQSLGVGLWFREEGVDCLTVSSPAMAEYFAEGGWEDITLAFPLNLRELDRLLALAQTIRLNLVVEDPAHLQALEARATQALNIFLLVDSGAGRTGLTLEQTGLAGQLVNRLKDSPHLRFAGLLTHAGHSYRARGRAEIGRVHQKSLEALRSFARTLPSPPPLVSVGDTPSCSTQTDYTGVQEIRPGNFVFYDLMQLQIGSCEPEDLALALACPVAAVHPERREAVVHGGAVHLAKDFILDDESGRPIYGRVAAWTSEGWDPLQILGQVVRLSQEHGIVQLIPAAASAVKPGDMLCILPVHACHTADAMKRYLTLAGEAIGMMPPAGFTTSG